MNSILEKNIKLLSEKQDKKFGEVLNNYTGQNENCAVIKNLSNEDIVGCIKDGKEIYLNSRYNAEYETELWVSDRVDEVNRPYFIYGFSNGMAVNKFKQKVSDKSVLIVYEPSFEIFYNVISNIDLTDIFENSRIILYVKGINEKDIRTIDVSIFGLDSIQKARYIILRQYDILFYNEYKDYIDILRQTVNAILADAVYYSRNSKMVQNVIAKNMKWLCEFRTVNQYIDKMGENGIAIIVGAGPSLSKNIELLKQIKGKAFILATDSAVKKMAKHNIKPDAFMSIDSEKNGLEYNDILINTPLIMDINVKPELVENNKSVKIISAKNAILISKICEKLKMLLYPAETGGSVSCSAFSVLKMWNFKKIVLIGHDFAYTGGMIHAEGIFENNNTKIEGEVRYVEDNDGNLIETGFDYEIYLHWFENAIAKWTDGEVINATEGGARVKGATVMTLKEVIDTYLKDREIVDYESIMKNMPPAFDDEEYEKAKQIIVDKRKSLDELLQKIESGIEIQNRLKKAFKKKETNKMILVSLEAKMKVITKFIDSYEDLDILYFYKGELVDIMNTETDETDTDKIIDKSIEWLKDMKQAAEDYKKDLELIISNL